MQISYSIWPPKDENMALFGHTLQKKLVGQMTSKSEEIAQGVCLARVNYIYNQFNTNNNAKLKNTTTIIKLSQTILVCSYSCDSCDSCVDHVVSLWNGLTSLWTQYINVVQIMRNLIEAERHGNWYLHLQAVSEKATIIDLFRQRSPSVGIVRN